MTILQTLRPRRGVTLQLPLLMIALAALGLFAGQTFAQTEQPAKAPEPTPPPEAEPPAGPKDYRELPVDENQIRTAGTRVTQLRLAGKFDNQADMDLFDGFYKKFALARWSLKANIEQLPKFRRDLTNNLRTCGTGGRPPAVQAHLNAMALRFMDGLASVYFHPAVRVNAMLMIGELNATEAPTALVTPTPLPEALPVLVGALGKAEKEDEPIEAIKVAAMVGIARHGRLGAIQGDNVRPVVAAMVKVLDDARPASRTVDGDTWLRAQAADVLAILKTPGPNNAVVVSLGKTIADDGLPLSSRCAASAALGGLTMRNVGGLNVTPIADALRQTILDACAAETQPAERRRLKARLHAVKLGLDGIAQVAGAPQSVAQLQQSVGTMLSLIEDRNLDPLSMMGKINEEVGKLQGPAAAPAKQP